MLLTFKLLPLGNVEQLLLEREAWPQSLHSCINKLLKLKLHFQPTAANQVKVHLKMSLKYTQRALFFFIFYIKAPLLFYLNLTPKYFCNL